MAGFSVRKSFIAGNWKMHGLQSHAKALIENIKVGASGCPDVDVLICPPFIHLAAANHFIKSSPLLLGAQNLYVGQQGPYTGEISGPMLADLGCKYVIVGHSERRTLFHEDLQLVAEKFKSAIAAKLHPILCVGETKAQREAGETEMVIKAQLDSVILENGIEAFRHALIAYEPVWAIGTGLNATPQQAQAIHAYIRDLLMQNNVDIAKTIRILYGGSMKPENASSLLGMPDIDGGLIGGASLDAESFLTICAAASDEASALKCVKRV